MAQQQQQDVDFWDWLGGRTAALRDWIDARFPMTEFFRSQLTGYYAPKNFNFWYFFGSLALVVLVLQIITGIWLTMNYKPSADAAFASVEYIMRDVEWGWLIRYMHSTGASFFFIVVYLHMFRGLLYGSYKAPRELLWVFGALIYLCLMGEAFMGYLLPWGQMSYWGAQVIISLFGTIPGIGPDLAEWIRGDYYISDITLNRFFALHVIAIPLLLLILVVLHLVALRQVGSNNPDGVEIKKTLGRDGHPVDGIPFHPYYITKDIVGVAVFCMFYAIVIFFAPEGGGYFLEPPNFEPANPLKTPEHIAPVWYFTPYYAMLRAIPPVGVSQFPGVAVMGAAVLVFLFLPWIDRHPVKSVRYRGPLFRSLLMVFAASFIVLGWLGMQPATPFYGELAFRLTELYFGFFVVLFAYSRRRSAGEMHLYTLLSLGFVVAIDLARFWALGFDKVHEFQWILMILPLAFAFLYMQLPIHTKLNEPLPVPERVTP